MANLHSIFYTWMIMILSIAFLVEIVFAHICHSLLLNIGALLKVSQMIMAIIQLISSSSLDEVTSMNTFGLGRVGVTAELMNCIFLYAMSFSLIMEGVKHVVDNLKFDKIEAHLFNSSKPSLIHHQHFRINRPDLFLYSGYMSAFLNAILIMGIVGESIWLMADTHGCVIAYHTNMYQKTKMMKKDERHKCYSSNFVSTASRLLSLRHILTHIIGLVLESLVILTCGIIVNTSLSSITHYIDSILSLGMIGICVLSTYPIAKKAMEILIQNFPDQLNLQEMVQSISDEVPDIISIHNIHVWQHVPHSYVATLHIVYSSADFYHANMDKVIEILRSRNIDDITIQPEFLKQKCEAVSRCLINCPNDCYDEEYNDSFFKAVRIQKEITIDEAVIVQANGFDKTSFKSVQCEDN